MKNEDAWPFMGAAVQDSPTPTGIGRRMDLCGIVERLQVVELETIR